MPTQAQKLATFMFLASKFFYPCDKNRNQFEKSNFILIDVSVENPNINSFKIEIMKKLIWNANLKPREWSYSSNNDDKNTIKMHSYVYTILKTTWSRHQLSAHMLTAMEFGFVQCWLREYAELRNGGTKFDVVEEFSFFWQR